jgi:hypothetical protein
MLANAAVPNPGAPTARKAFFLAGPKASRRRTGERLREANIRAHGIRNSPLIHVLALHHSGLLEPVLLTVVDQPMTPLHALGLSADLARSCKVSAQLPKLFAWVAAFNRSPSIPMGHS